MGFRFTVHRVGLRLGLTGWAKNLSDDRVEVVAEGQKELLEQFHEMIQQDFKGYIKDCEIEWLDHAGEFTAFDIRF